MKKNSREYYEQQEDYTIPQHTHARARVLDKITNNNKKSTRFEKQKYKNLYIYRYIYLTYIENRNSLFLLSTTKESIVEEEYI